MKALFFVLFSALMANASTYKVTLVDQNNAPLAKYPVILGEYKTTWYDGTTNKHHETKTDKSGYAVISYKEDRYHYFDTVLCVTTGKNEDICKGIASIYEGKVMCFESVKKNRSCKGSPKTKCTFDIQVVDSENIVKVQCIPQS